jgi:hypothetical protein
MTKARTIADLGTGFVNISDTGTEGTKVASGTTAQRGSTAGQLRFNSQTGLAEYYTGTAFKSIDAPPTVSGVGVSNITDAQISANYDLSISGSGFNSGATVKFIGNDGTEYASPTVTVNSDTSISARVPTSVTNANEPYDVKVTNISGLSATLANAFNVDGKPAWQTASGTLATIYDDLDTTHATVSATDPEGDTVIYSETGGTVLSTNNLILNSSTGAITGDPTDVGSDTTLSFNLRATSGTNTSDRAFNIIVKPSTLDLVDFFGDNSGKSLFKFQGNGTDEGGVANFSFGHPSISNNHTFTSAKFDNGLNKLTGGSYGFTSTRAYSNFTVTGWHSSTVLGTGDDFRAIFGHQDTGTLLTTKKDGIFYLGLQRNGFSNGNQNSADKYMANNVGCPTLSNNTFFHFAWTRDGTNSKLYVNGVLGNTITEDISGISLNPTSNNVALYLGAGSTVLGNSTYDTAGLYDHFRIFDKKLSDSEVLQLYNFESAR